MPAFDVAASPIPGVQLQKIVDIVDASRGEDNAALLCNRVALACLPLRDVKPVARCDCSNVLFDRLLVVHSVGAFLKDGWVVKLRKYPRCVLQRMQ